VLVIGDHGSLKRSLINAVAYVENWHVEYVYPSSLTNDDLFGKLKSCLTGWFSKKDGIKLIVFSGNLDSRWAECLNSLTDDNKVLRSSSNEIVKLPFEFRIVFETSDISKSTPSIISRLSAIYMYKERSVRYPFNTIVNEKL